MRLSRGSAIFLTVLVALGVLAVLGVRTLLADPEPEDTGDPVTVQIPEGAGIDDVAEILEDEGVIASAWRFRLTARFDGRASEIPPGEYDLVTGSSNDEILDELAGGPPPPPTFSFTLPEGLTVPQALERIADADDSPFEVEELEESLVTVALPEWVPDDLPENSQEHEGLLFPATYEYEVDVPPERVLGDLVARTDEELDDVEPPDGWDVYDVLIAASLIEREVRVDEERTLVSSVIHNRLEEERRLQIDATVQYAQGEHAGRLLFEDLEIDSAWNTYEADGLPPTPIAAPGRAAIDAAAEPDDTGYRYYVVCDTETGEHAFAESDDEHQSNVARYREVQDEGGRYCDEVEE